jgi:hypothetical protein
MFETWTWNDDVLDVVFMYETWTWNDLEWRRTRRGLCNQFGKLDTNCVVVLSNYYMDEA